MDLILACVIGAALPLTLILAVIRAVTSMLPPQLRRLCNGRK